MLSKEQRSLGKHPIGGMFLWHSPHGHPHWALPSKFDPSGARTFLKASKDAPQLPRLLSPLTSVVGAGIGLGTTMP
jgi:hypothetical protein